MNEAPRAECIGFIMDGNRRWARARGLPGFKGHEAGYKKLQEVVRWAREAGVPHIAAYAFSTENWRRSEEEVSFMLALFRSVLENEIQKMVSERVRVRFVGDRSRFGADLRELMESAEAATAQAYDITLHILVSYGGRAEIVAAVNALIADGAGEATEESFAQKLWTETMPDPDIVVRTGGEKRLSNFLPWQTVYSELFFSDSFWPDFSKEEFDAVLAGFARRERRNGK